MTFAKRKKLKNTTYLYLYLSVQETALELFQCQDEKTWQLCGNAIKKEEENKRSGTHTLKNILILLLFLRALSLQNTSTHTDNVIYYLTTLRSALPQVGSLALLNIHSYFFVGFTFFFLAFSGQPAVVVVFYYYALCLCMCVSGLYYRYSGPATCFRCFHTFL